MVLPISFLDWIENYRTFHKKDKKSKSQDSANENASVSVPAESNENVSETNGNASNISPVRGTVWRI